MFAPIITRILLPRPMPDPTFRSAVAGAPATRVAARIAARTGKGSGPCE